MPNPLSARAKLSTLGLLLALSASSCRESLWTELNSLNELRDVFNQDQGRARIVLLLSPT